MKSTLLSIFLFLVVGINFSFWQNNLENQKNIFVSSDNNQTAECTIIPIPYDHALRNPLKGFTTRGIYDHPWASTAHTYIRWNDLENNETDGIEKIISFSNNKWKGLASKNIKVIPRVYLHWDGDQKYWPADMQEDDYTSAQFKERVIRLIERLGVCWDNDPRIAFIEMGIFGKWGEQEQPGPTSEVEKLVSDAFAKAFKNKKVSVREVWNDFTQHPYGEYWDSWAHLDQMWGHGNSIKEVNEGNDRYKENYIGGEVAYNWGNSDIQPGPSPTASVALEKHRTFIINTIRWLHCTQLRWIDAYDQVSPAAKAGAEEIQKAFGYRYVIDEVKFSIDDSLKIAFDVSNTGSAPFYYKWPVEVALLDTITLKPVWKAKMDSVDIRDWLPGEGWTDPEWNYVGSWQEYHPNENWNTSTTSNWATPPAVNRVEDKFKVDLPDGTYILSLSILDPAGDIPSIKFATENYLNGGRHPMGLVAVGENTCSPLPEDFQFDEPNEDKSLYYDDDFEIVYERDPERTPFGEKTWRFPTDTVLAWQYDYMDDGLTEKYFSLDSANTIGIYGCNDTTGLNFRSYKDTTQFKDAAQFNWNNTAQTFQKNGQWVEYSVEFNIDVPYQLLLRARNNVDANFKLIIYNLRGDTVFFRDSNLKGDFTNQGGGNEQTDWFLSTFPIKGLWGNYIVRFDWYDNLGEPGIFGGFSFVESNIDATPPGWYFISLGTFRPGTALVVMTTEDANVYLVPEGTAPDTESILSMTLSSAEVTAYQQANITTTGLDTGGYVLYAIDSSNNISVASSVIKLKYPVNATKISNESGLTIQYNSANQLIKIKNVNELSQIDVYNIVGKKAGTWHGSEKTCDFQTNGFISGVYLVRIIEKNGNITAKKIYIY